MKEEKHPWDKLEGETDKAFGHFCAYRDIPTHRRSLAELHRIEGKSPEKQVSGHWHRWRIDFEWDARARAYDQYRLDEERRELLSVQKERLAARRASSDSILSACERLFKKEAVLEDMFERAPASVVTLYRIASDIRDKTDKEMLGINTLQVQESPREPTEQEEEEILQLIALLKGQAKEGNVLASRLLFKINGVEL